MSKRSRFFVILLVLVIAGFFLYPTLNWYFMVQQDKKEIALGSKEQIRNYAMSKAIKELEKLNEMARADKNNEVPKEYQFLVKKAKANYKTMKKAIPSKWTIAEVLLSFGSENKVLNELETYYRTEIFALKEKGKGILQLGLDLVGGMNVLLKADMENFSQRLGHVPTAEERKTAIDQAIEILSNRIDKF